MSTETTLYSLALAPLDEELRVWTLEGKEAISELYSFDLRVTTPLVHEDNVTSLLLGQRARLTMRAGSATKTVAGIISKVWSDGPRPAPPGTGASEILWQYRLRLVPVLWLLTKRRNTRIFQNLRVDEVVDAVLGRFGIMTSWQLTRDYPPRAYCTQYEETDYDFVKRLLAESGIFFYFTPGTATTLDAWSDDALVLGDDASSYGASRVDDGEAPSVEIADGEDVRPGEQYLERFDLRRALKSTAATYREYDAERPHIPIVAAACSDDSDGSGATYDLEVYEHHGNYRAPDWANATGEADLMMRQLQRAAVTGSGAGHCTWLACGSTFDVEDHSGDLGGTYVITRLAHRGVDPAFSSTDKNDGSAYENELACVPVEVAFIPARPKRETVQVVLTATVVGPQGEDVYVDSAGQIKVQFHWDRDGGYGEGSSCWIRTMQAWAGAGFGTQFIPRVGMEVVVTFEGGDPDKPIVLGCMHNGTHPTAFSLPGDKTKSGIRTRSTPSSDGSNELSFEDASGAERIYLHAERDFDEVIEGGHSVIARGNDDSRVEGNQRSFVGGDRSSDTQGDLIEDVGKNATRRIEGDRMSVVRGNADARVQGHLTTRVGGNERRTVTGRLDVETLDDATYRSRGCLTTLVGKSDANRSYVLHVEGRTMLSSTKELELSSDKAIVLKVGKSCIRIAEDKIEIQSPAIAASGSGAGLTIADDKLKLAAKKAAQVTAESLLLKSDEGSVAMAKEVKIDGKKILMNSPSQAEDEPLPPPNEPTKIELVDEAGNPVAHERFVIRLEDGSEVSGVLDANGQAELLLDGDGEVTFPDAGDNRAA